MAEAFARVLSGLGGVPVNSSWLLDRAQGVCIEGRIVVHPYALAQMKAGDDLFERLRIVEEVSVARAHARLDALASKLVADRLLEASGIFLSNALRNAGVRRG